MKKGNLRALIILVIILLALISNSFVFNIFNEYSICAFMLLLILVTYLLIGYRKVKSRYDKDLILTIIIYLAVYYIVIYLLGLFIGFTHNVYSLKLINIIKNIFPVIILITLTEILRYTINSQIFKSVFLLILSAITFSVVDLTLILGAIDYTEFESVLVLFGLYLLPSLSKSIFLTYLSYKTSYKPCLVYRFIFEIPLYLIPIIPNFGDYIQSIVYVCAPLILFMIIFKQFEKIKKEIIIVKNKHIRWFSIFLTCLFIILLVGLISGKFKYEAVVIATGSMQPNIERGDIVIVKKINEDEKKEIEINQVIAFKMDDKVVVHRVIEKYDFDKYVLFQTKGDNNKSPDAYLIDTDDIVGITNKRIRYLGYPTVYLYEKVKKKEK